MSDEAAVDKSDGRLDKRLGHNLGRGRARLRLAARLLLGFADDLAGIELQPPAVATVLGDTVEFERADGGELGGERHGDLLRPAAGPPAAAEYRRQRRQLQQ